MHVRPRVESQSQRSGARDDSNYTVQLQRKLREKSEGVTESEKETDRERGERDGVSEKGEGERERKVEKERDR